MYSVKKSWKLSDTSEYQTPPAYPRPERTVSQSSSLRNMRLFFLGLGWMGSGAMLDEPGPVGGVVLGDMAGASRDAPAVTVLSGAGGALGMSEVGMVPLGSEGEVVGAGLGTAVSPRFLLSA